MSSDYYSSDRILAEYLLFHYGTPEEILEGKHPEMTPFLEYPARCVTECVLPFYRGSKRRALDLGCAVGRASFELSKHFDCCLGIDLSENFIDAANRLRLNGSVAFRAATEGNRARELVAKVPESAVPGRVQFQVGDALNLPSDLGVFDVVLMANLIDRVPSPTRCLQGMADVVDTEGILVVTSPYTWLSTFTPEEEWLAKSGPGDTAMETRAAMASILAPHFRLLHHQDLPFLIREHARKFQWSVAEATIWLRTDA